MMIILGAGGHAKDLMTIIKKSNFKPFVFFDDSENDLLYFLDNYKIIKNIKDLEVLILHDDKIAIGTGSPIVRRQLYEKTKYLKGKYINLISDTAILGTIKVKLGWGLNIMHQVFISNSVTIGNGVLINRSAGIHHDVRIGNFCEIGPNANVLGGAVIGNNVMIGAGATILPNIYVKDNTVIGAGAVVTKDINTEGIYVGMPAKKMEKRVTYKKYHETK